MRSSILAVLFAASVGSPALADGDWTGFFLGAQVGNLNVDPSTGSDGDDIAGGIHGGYDYDFGQVVLGGELEYDWTGVSIASGAAKVNGVGRVKARLGYDLGPTLLYVAAGWAKVDTSLGNDNGGFVGLGGEYLFDSGVSFGAEWLYHDFDDIGGTGIGAKANSINLRASFRF